MSAPIPLRLILPTLPELKGVAARRMFKQVSSSFFDVQVQTCWKVGADHLPPGETVVCDFADDAIGGRTSKHRLTPHLIPYTPPYTFTPFLKPPNNSTLKSLKTQSTSQQSIQQSRNKATYQAQYNNPKRNPKHKAPTNSAQNPEATKRKNLLTPHLTSPPPLHVHPFLNPPNKSTLSTRNTRSTSPR